MKNAMQKIVAALLLTTLAASNAVAADNTSAPADSKPLALGRPAGVQQAQIWKDPITIIGLIGIGVIAAVAVSASSGNSNGSASTATTN